MQNECGKNEVIHIVDKGKTRWKQKQALTNSLVVFCFKNDFARCIKQNKDNPPTEKQSEYVQL